ncbi:MAG TPA: hypothetical protein VFG39_03745 [Balneolaceae bacterium]|nr:hypothetical protein [Balneolaceae bacterium]
MKKHDQHNDPFIPYSSNIADSEHNSFSVFFEQIHTINALCLIAGLSQILLGMSVITISILGLIQEPWLANTLTMLASISTIIGCYLVYITVSKRRDPQALLRGAMKRVIESKN